MVVCKYFQQGTCRYGQYCRFQHINNFGNGANQGNSNKQFVEGKSIVLGVAEEVVAAERGGQWLLSCFGPLKEQPCIPGMEDVSPEEVRWEMYQAQKNGTVDQMKLQFQQLCQTMTAKREALKNPTHETAAMLEKLQKTNRDGTFGGKTNFALSSSQMAQSATSPSGSNVFGAKTFGASAANPFGGGFSASNGASSSIFGRTTTSNTSVFGAKPSFGGNTAFGGQTSTNTVFGGTASKSSAGVFGTNQANMQSFATANPPNNSVFGGGTSQTVFAQPTTFGSTNQVNSPFSMAQSGQSTQSVFGTTTTATNSPFGSQSTALFGAAKNPPNIFGTTATAQSGNSIFGGPSGTPTNAGSTSMFVQPKGTAAFGGAPVFGTTGGFAGNSQAGLMFGGQANFENAALPPNGVFGSAAVQSTTFGSNAQTTNSFGALAAPNATPFGPVVSTTSSVPFGTSSGPFGASASSAFGRTATFGGTMQSTNESGSVFGGAPAVSTGESPFGSKTAGGAFGIVAPPVSQPFGAPAFGNTPSTPFASTTSTTTTSNPFAPSSQQQNNSPFGIAATTLSSGGTFGQSNFGSITTASIIDENAYTVEGQLTDDDKALYLSEQFVLGKIPLNPPTIELR